MPRADVLIITAVPDEHAAVLEAGGGAGAWTYDVGPMNLSVAFRDVDAGGGGSLTLAVTQALGMGGPSAVIAAASAIKEYEVRCLAMCGVCAGRRGDVALGDVIIADRVWQYDAGKRKAETTDRERIVEQQEDIEMYRLHPPAWKQAAERFQLDPKAAWLALRPRSYEAQGDWILERVLRGADPVADPESKTMCADFDKALARLWQKRLLADGTLDLTEAGRKHIGRVLLMNRNALPEAKPLRVHVGPIASGNQVMQDEDVFARLSASVRKVLGIDMEAAAIGDLARTGGLEYAVVMKAVMDHADADKSDNFKNFAARASAECLLAFVRQNVPPRATKDDPILTPGTSARPKLASPASLLNARHEVVPFHGRKDVLDELRRWCEGDDGVRARLIHAEGGMGKTRLAIELCKQMREQGWRAGFLREAKKLADLLESHRPVLAVLDYAESRPDLREMLASVAGRRGKKALCIMLLARNADAWWTDLLRSDGAVKDVLNDQEPLRLPPVTPDREAVFREAAKAFSEKEYEGVVPSLADPRYERVLYVHAAAFAAVKGHDVKVATLMDDTLDHEERFWREQLRDRWRASERNALHGMRLAITALTLKGGAHDEAEAENIISDETLVVLLRDLYPGRDGQRYIGGLEPDLLGEAMVWRALHEEGAGAGPYLDRVFESADGQAIRTGFTVLGRLSEDRPEAAGWIARVLDRDVAGRAMEAFVAAKTVGERTAHAALGMVLARALEREGTVELAKRLDAALPERTVSLREVGRWVLEKRLADLPDESALEERARLLNNLAIRQIALGQREAAVASMQKAVDIYRRLSNSRPMTFLQYFAGSSDHLGTMQSVLGRREAALASMREAIDVFRKLAESRPEVFLRDLALSLNNLGAMQSRFGLHEAALASSQEAVDIHRKLAESQPGTFLPVLAESLNHLSMKQSAIERHEAALASSQEAIDIHRKAAQARPDAFLPALAGSLSNLSTMQRSLGQYLAARASSQKAVDIWRNLAQARPDAFLPDLAGSLNNLSAAQSALEQHEAALASALTAMDHYRKLARVRPERFMSDFTISLNTLSVRQSALGQREAALASSQEALDAIWKLFLCQPGAFEHHARVYLNNLRKNLETLGRTPSPELLQRIETFAALSGQQPLASTT